MFFVQNLKDFILLIFVINNFNFNNIRIFLNKKDFKCDKYYNLEYLYLYKCIFILVYFFDYNYEASLITIKNWKNDNFKLDREKINLKKKFNYNIDSFDYIIEIFYKNIKKIDSNSKIIKTNQKREKHKVLLDFIIIIFNLNNFLK